MKRRTTSLAVLFVAALVGCAEPGSSGPAPDTVFMGTFITLDSTLPEVEALAVRGGRIVFAGSRSEASRLAGEITQVVEIPGVAVPGFSDAHVHLSSLGALLDEGLNLRGLDKDEILGLVAEATASAPADAWIRGGGWDEGFFASGDAPTASDLEGVSSNHPVVLSRIDGHASWVNSRVLELAGITQSTIDPDGGRIVRDASNRPTGVLVDNAQNLVSRVTPETDSEEDRERRIRLALDQYARWGLTSVHDAGVGLETIEIYTRLLERGELPVRIYAMAQGEPAVRHYLDAGSGIDLGDGRLTVRSFKLMLDGALGSRGALFADPYSDAPAEVGLRQIGEAEFDALIAESLERGFQVNAHAIGDLGVRWGLDAFERAGVSSEDRFRIEHASTIAPQDLPRFAALGVIASMQPVFVGEYGRWAEDRVGPDRVRWVMPIRDLLATGAVVASGTDFTASDSGDPIATLDALVSRRGADGNPPEGWFPEQGIDLEAALRSMSTSPAFAAFREDDLGQLNEGRFADFTVLSEDPRLLSPGDLRNLTVTMTVVNGEATYRGDDPEDR